MDIGNRFLGQKYITIDTHVAYNGKIWFFENFPTLKMGVAVRPPRTSIHKTSASRISLECFKLTKTVEKLRPQWKVHGPALSYWSITQIILSQGTNDIKYFRRKNGRNKCALPVIREFSIGLLLILSYLLGIVLEMMSKFVSRVFFSWGPSIYTHVQMIDNSQHEIFKIKKFIGLTLWGGGTVLNCQNTPTL